MQLGISAIWSQKEKGVAWSGRCHTHFPQKTLKKKLNLTEESQDAKKNFFDLIFNMLMLWGKCMPIAFEFQQGLFCILTNCQTYWACFRTTVCQCDGNFDLQVICQPITNTALKLQLVNYGKMWARNSTGNTLNTPKFIRPICPNR